MEALPPVVFPVADGITAIDTFMGGRARVHGRVSPGCRRTDPGRDRTGHVRRTGHRGARRTRDGSRASSPTSSLTHIHLDHAGGVGQLARALPARHGVGARARRAASRRSDPPGREHRARLGGSRDARAVRTDRARRRAAAFVRLEDTDTIALGDRDLLVLDTPGHASHHVALVDSRTGAVFTGDALGIHVPDLPVLRPATPPPEFDLERYVDSIERIRGRRSSVLLFAHFGPLDDVGRDVRPRDPPGAGLGERRARGRAGGGRSRRARRTPRGRGARTTSRRAPRRRSTSRCSRIALRLLSSIRMNAQGLARYWQKRRERGARIERSAERRPGAPPRRTRSGRAA